MINKQKYINKMKKSLIIIAIATMSVLVKSCNTAKFYFRHSNLARKERVSSVSGQGHGPFDFEVKNNRMLTVIDIDGRSDTVFIDSGFNGAIAECHPKSELTPEYSRIKMTGALKRSKVYMKIDTVNAKFLWHHHDIRYDICLNFDSPCDIPIAGRPLMGTKMLFAFDFGYCKVAINFSDQKISYYRYDDSTFCLDGYKPMRCKLKRKNIYVYPVINGKECKCIFDTGNGNACFILNEKDSGFEKRANDIVYEGAIGSTVNGVINSGEYHVRKEETIKLGDNEFIAPVLYTSENKNNNIGLRFISQFDWFYDDSNPDVIYYKPREVQHFDFQETGPYKLQASEDGLMIITRIVDERNTFEFGDIIKSVNGEEITGDNICHYVELLNNSKDWSGFKIEVSK